MRVSLSTGSVMIAAALIAGCTSTKSSNTARTAVEQLLISTSVDETLDGVDFSPFADTDVYVDEKYMDSVDKNYVIASVRHRLMQQGARLAAKPEEAQVIVELRSGAIGTDSSESYLGMPEISLPGMLTLPEVRFITRSRQTGTAKIGLVAYNAKTGEILGSGGTSLARSDDNNWYVLGIGPYQNGTLKQAIGKARPAVIGNPGTRDTAVAFEPAPAPENADDQPDVQWASGEAEKP